LPDLQDYMQKYNDFARVVNAYSPHEHVYEQLMNRKGIVVVRGSGIVASRVLQRIIDDRERHGAQTTIWHIFRTYVAGAEGPIFFRRPGADGWAFQGFNYTKSAWTGQHRKHILSLARPEDRAKYADAVGGTTTPIRNDWRRQLKEGRRDGFYRVHVGEVNKMEQDAEGRIVTHVRSSDGASLEIPADFVIDATGLEQDVREHRLLADLIDFTGAQLNPKRKLSVKPNFEIEGTANGDARIYASGTMTYGSYYAPVDSFLGLQYAALQIADDLAKYGFGKHIGIGRSFSQWVKWMLDKPI
jgi:lysine/ornithine N-monooxygenase